jgi:hypothetical protein
MKNTITCGNCNTENPFYQLTCKNCSTYLRDRVYNVDLFKILGLLIESPQKAFKLIVFSEHKNFIYLILFFAAIKFYVDANFFSVWTSKLHQVHGNIFLEIIIILLLTILFIFILSAINSFVEKSNGLTNRNKDNFAIVMYSLLPHAFAAVILFPIELILFGEYLFSTNPSPFAIKETIAFAILVIESLVILWSIFLLIIGNFVVTKNIVYSIVAALIVNIAIFYSLYLSSKILFS